MMLFTNAAVYPIHAAIIDDEHETDHLFALTIVPKWSEAGNYYFISLIDDEQDGTNCIARKVGNYSFSDLDVFIRENIAAYLFGVYPEPEDADKVNESVEIYYL